MKREYPDSPLVGVGAIIIDDGRVLLVKRGHPPLAGEWSIPGGALEVGETVREGAVRETESRFMMSGRSVSNTRVPPPRSTSNRRFL